jgi:alkylation response protein AidB-like acyl-CoA dehydrogenase
LGKRGEGFKIAMNSLNVGRIKLGIAVTGASKKVINYAIGYANERKQFKTPISSFGAIQFKLAEMATKTYVADAGNYRCGQNIEDNIKRLESEGLTLQDAKLQGVEEYAIECAILKVFFIGGNSIYIRRSCSNIWWNGVFCRIRSRGML